MNPVKLTRTVTETVQAAKITALNALLDDGTSITVTGPVSVGDHAIIDSAGKSSILSAADYAAALVPAGS